MIESLMNHVDIISKMYESKLNYDLIKYFSTEKIENCCDIIKQSEIRNYEYQNNVVFQKELVKNSDFFNYAIKLYSKECNIPDAEDLIEMINENKENILDYKIDDIIFVLKNMEIKNIARYTYLKFFMQVDKEYKNIVIDNLSYYYAYNDKLLDCSNQEIIELFKSPFLSSRSLIPANFLEKVYKMLCDNHELKNLIEFLYSKNLLLPLEIEKYKILNINTKETLERIEKIQNNIIGDNLYRLLLRWLQNDCSLFDLRILCKQLDIINDSELQKIISDQSSYINFIYGSKMKNIPFQELNKTQEGLIVYAIKNNKKSFLNLIENNSELFLKMSGNSLLFQTNFYQTYVNINELNTKDLQDLYSMICFNNKISYLKEQIYTFNELKVLYNTKLQYIYLYNYLLDLRIDKRLLIIKQLIKKDLLNDISEEKIKKLAQNLILKPLYSWIENDFSKINGISAKDAIELLIDYDKFRRFIPDIKEQNELAYIIRNFDSIQEYNSLYEIKNNIENIDIYWNKLKNEMNFTDEFVKKYKNNIKDFLLKNGAEYAYLYYNTIYKEQREAFKLIVKSELMGEFKKLKYHETDLSREIEYQLSEEQIQKWQENLTISDNQYEIAEYDDFYYTMILGEKPQRTCLSYKRGMYNRCLLACFDSNKKILYAKKNGRIVARAMIRLTKGTYYREKTKALSFIDVEKQDKNTNSVSKQEYLTLFLEKIYTSGISEEETIQIEKLFIKMMEDKAGQMDALLVLSRAYYYCPNTYLNTIFYIFISKSKASAQYLDSLSGQATISDEGEYRSGSFLIWKSQANFEKEVTSHVA